MLDTIDRWRAGELADQEAYNALVGDLAEMDDILARYKAAREVVRGQLERIVRRAGGKMSGQDYEATTVEPSKSTNYDARALDSLMAELAAAGDVYTAGRIAEARKVTERAGYMRISKTK